MADEDGRLIELNAAAQRAGVELGMDGPKALARCGKLQLLNRNEAGERHARRLLWNACWQITPQIALTAPGLATLQIAERAKGNLAQSIGQLLAYLQESGLPARAACAPTPDWAQLAAMATQTGQFHSLPDESAARALLDALPLSVCEELDPRMVAIIEGWGVTTLGALARLPRQAVGERLSAPGLQAWDRLNGQTNRLLKFHELEPDYTQRFDQEEPLESLEPILFFLQRGAEALAAQLAQTGKVARAVYLRLAVERGTTYRKTIRLPEATRQVDLLMRLLRHHLEQVQLTGNVTCVQLGVEPTPPLGKQAGLFERSVRNPWRLAETLDELAGVVGDDRFGTPRPEDTHRPDTIILDSGFHFESRVGSHESRVSGPISDSQLPTPDCLHNPQSTMSLPLRRYRPPLAARVVVDNGRPGHLQSDPAQGAIVGVRGPFRSSGEWWRDDEWSTEEWDVELDGAGVFRISQQAGQWLLEGAYD